MKKILFFLDLTQNNGCVHFRLFLASQVISKVNRNQVDEFCKKEMNDYEFGGLAHWDGR